MARTHEIARMLAALAAAAALGCQAPPMAVGHAGEHVAPPTDTGGAAENIAPNVASPAFRTDTTAYTLQPTSIGFGTDIPFTFTNPTDDTVYVVNCNGATELNLEKSADGTWVGAWSPAVPTCLGPPIIIPAGGTWQDTVRIEAGAPGSNNYPQFSASNLNGAYRLVWTQLVSTFDLHAMTFGDPLPLDERVSNTFVLHAPGS